MPRGRLLASTSTAFRRAAGRDTGRHVARMRLERAAYLVAVTEAPLTEIGLAVGFQNPETFSRAFRRWFGAAPSAYRKQAYETLSERKERNRDFRGDGCKLSEVRFVHLRPATLSAIRRRAPTAPPACPVLVGRCLLDDAEAGRSPRRALPRSVGFYPYSPCVLGDLHGPICLPGTAVRRGAVRHLAFDGWSYAVSRTSALQRSPSLPRGGADGIRRSTGYVFPRGPPLQVSGMADRQTRISTLRGGVPPGSRREGARRSSSAPKLARLSFVRAA